MTIKDDDDINDFQIKAGQGFTVGKLKEKMIEMRVGVCVCGGGWVWVWVCVGVDVCVCVCVCTCMCVCDLTLPKWLYQLNDFFYLRMVQLKININSTRGVTCS